MNSKLSEKKFQIFVSSVGTMMEEERSALINLIWQSGHIPIAMENFCGNHGQTSIEVTKNNLDRADIVIFIFGFTYGNIIGDSLSCNRCPVKEICEERGKDACAISYTNFEYLYVHSKEILHYCIILKEIESERTFQKQLDSFIKKHITNEGEQNKFRKAQNAEYYGKMDKYNKLIMDAKKKYSYFYEFDSEGQIKNSIGSAFMKIQNNLLKDGENIPGLINGSRVQNEFAEKNHQIEELKIEIEQYKKISNMLDEIKQTHPALTTAVTGTCIPFLYDKKEEKIITYLVCNSAYSGGSRVMFPGGHAFVNEDSPEIVAIMKAKTEAGLDVKPIDLYFSFNNVDNEFSSRFTIYRPPHFTYLFEEDGSAKCYKDQNHLKHYDLAYVCEINEIHSITECSQVRIAVKFPNKLLTLNEIKKILEDNISQYNLQNQLTARERESTGEYIAKMIIDAHTNYIKYLKQLGRL